MSWHYLREQEGEFSEACCSGGEPLPPLKSKTTHAEFYCNGKLMESYLDSLSGTTCAHLTENHGVEKSMSSQEDSHVKTSHAPGEEQGSKDQEVVFGKKWLELSMKFDRLTSSLKTHRCLFREVLHWSSVILPRWGMMQNGVFYARTTPKDFKEGNEFGYWPTLTTFGTACSGKNGNFGVYTLGAAILAERNKWPLRTIEAKKYLNSRSVKVALNPDWCDWIMRWPIGWTDLRPLGTDRIQLWLRSHGEY